jgi:outer membrane usher protein
MASKRGAPAPGVPGRRVWPACLCLAVVSWPAHASVRVQAMRVGMDSRHTRVVWESDGPIRATLSRDESHGILIVDLGDLTQSPALAGVVKQIGLANPFIAKADLRSNEGNKRLELALRGNVGARLFHLQRDDRHADRLVLDLYPARGGGDDMVRLAAGDTPSVDTASRNTAANPPLAGSTPPKRQPVHVKDVRVAVAPDRIRFVLESDRPIQARVVHPTKPGALSIELGDVVLDQVLASLPEKIRRNPYLSTVQLDHDRMGTTVVLVAPAAVDPQIFNLPPGEGHGERLVVDVFPERTLPASSLQAEPTPSEGVLAASPAPSAPAKPAAPAPATDAFAETWLDVLVNGTRQDTALVLQGHDEDLLVRVQDLERWRVRAAGLTGITHGSERYVRLSAVKRLGYRVDPSQGTLSLDVPADLLETSRLSGLSRAADQPTRSPPGAYLNYDVFAGRDEAGSTRASALVETGVFGGWGSGSSTTLVRHTAERTQGVRLDTTWTYDRPERMASFRLGDGIGGASSWGRSVRFGGVQWATNFATQPGFITFPLPTLSGIATAPSTVEYYVNDTLRLQRNVPSGPFAIQDLPVVTGQGDVRMVVRDLLGREQVITQPFYASGQILAAGLRAFSYDAGFVRENYGLASNDYGRLAVTGTERKGLSDRFTGEVHAEALRDQQTLGVGGSLLMGNAGVLSASVAGSRSAAGTGGLLGIGFQHQSRYLSYGVHTELTSARFAQLGYQAPDRPPRQSTSAFMSLGFGRSGSLGLSYTHQELSNQQDVELLGLSYNRTLNGLGYLTMSALRFFTGDTSPLFALTLTVPLGARDSISVNGRTHGGSAGGSVQYQSNLPAGTGVGYRLQAGLSPGDPNLADVALQNDTGTYTLGMAQAQGQRAYQASARGGFAFLGGKLFASRHLDDSFAVVQVPGFAHVRVYADNQEVATTDREGYALIPRLRSYQKNPIRIEQADLPLDAEIEGLQLDAVPYFRSGLALTFPVTHSDGAMLSIRLHDGSALPAGADVLVDGNTTPFPVGLRGEVYLTGLRATNKLQARWAGQSCDLVLVIPESSEPLPHLGPLTCEGVHP